MSYNESLTVTPMLYKKQYSKIQRDEKNDQFSFQMAFVEAILKSMLFSQRMLAD